MSLACRRSTRLVSGLLCCAALATGCGPQETTSTSDEGAEPTASAPASSASEADSTPSTTTSGSESTQRVAVYWVGRSDRGPRLFREFATAEASDPVQGSLDLLATGEPSDKDYRSRWPEGTTLTGGDPDGDSLTVDLGAAASDGAAADAVLALQQLVHTVTAADPAVRSVRVTRDGEPVDNLWGGADVPRTGVTRADPLDVLAPIWMDSVTDGATVGRTVRFGGAASVFEGTVSWQVLTGPSGKVVRDGFSTAAEGAPGRGTWRASTKLDPGTYVLRAFEESAESGEARFVDDKTVTVR